MEKRKGGTEAELRVKAAFPSRSLGTRTKKVMMCSSECLCCYLTSSRLIPSLHSGSQAAVLPLSNCWRSQEGRALCSNPATAEAVLRPSPCGAWQAGMMQILPPLAPPAPAMIKLCGTAKSAVGGDVSIPRAGFHSSCLPAISRLAQAEFKNQRRSKCNTSV